MVKNYIDSIRKSIINTNNLIEECIVNLLNQYGYDGADGLELPCHNDYTYSVVSEIEPMEFKVVNRIRIGNNDKLEMQFICDDKWTRLRMVDMPFLLDEVEHALELDERI